MHKNTGTFFVAVKRRWRMTTFRGKAHIHLLIRLWADEGLVNYEIVDKKVFEDSELILNLPEGMRPMEDWVSDAVDHVDIEDFMPSRFEVCEEPILYEVRGIFKAFGYKDYWGEYDEEYEFECSCWTCEIEEDNFNGEGGNL